MTERWPPDRTPFGGWPFRPRTIAWPVLLALLGIGGALAASSRGAAPATQPAAATRPSSITPLRRPVAQYEVISQRNIFLRHAVHEAGTSSYQPHREPPPTWVLTGIALVGSERVAFLENSRTGATQRLQAGQTLAGLRLERIEPQFIELAGLAGPAHRINLGDVIAAEVTPATTGAGAAITAAAGTLSVNSEATELVPTTAPSSESSILERMKARRSQELAP